MTVSELYLSQTRGISFGTQKTFFSVQLMMNISKTDFFCHHKTI